MDVDIKPHDIYVLVIFFVLTGLLVNGNIKFDWYAGIIVAILSYFGVKMGVRVARKEI